MGRCYQSRGRPPTLAAAFPIEPRGNNPPRPEGDSGVGIGTQEADTAGPAPARAADAPRPGPTPPHPRAHPRLPPPSPRRSEGGRRGRPRRGGGRHQRHQAQRRGRGPRDQAGLRRRCAHRGRARPRARVRRRGVRPIMRPRPPGDGRPRTLPHVPPHGHDGARTHRGPARSHDQAGRHSSPRDGRRRRSTERGRADAAAPRECPGGIRRRRLGLPHRLRERRGAADPADRTRRRGAPLGAVPHHPGHADRTGPSSRDGGGPWRQVRLRLRARRRVVRHQGAPDEQRHQCVLRGHHGAQTAGARARDAGATAGGTGPHHRRAADPRRVRRCRPYREERQRDGRAARRAAVSRARRAPGGRPARAQPRAAGRARGGRADARARRARHDLGPPLAAAPRQVPHHPAPGPRRRRPAARHLPAGDGRDRTDRGPEGACGQPRPARGDHCGDDPGHHRARP